MKQVITAKLKLVTTPAQYQTLRTMQLAYRDGLNLVSRYAFEQGKLSNQTKLHQGCYATLRGKLGLPSQLACSVTRQVSATYKGLWTKVRQNNEHRAAGRTKKRYRGLDNAPHYSAPTVTLVHRRDYQFRKADRVSVQTLTGRIIVPYLGFTKHIVLIHTGATLGEAKLWLDKPRKQFYLLVTLTLDLPDPTPDSLTEVAGYDVGQRYLAVGSTLDNRTAFHSGKRVRHKVNHSARLRKRLQTKGTRSAKERLRAISGRERRFKLDANHVVARRIAERHPHTLIGIEDLKHINERTTRHHQPKASRKQRKANARRGQWSFAELHALITCKAARNGSLVVRVDPYLTSQKCPQCGHAAPDNRPGKGLTFCCRNCSHTLHADLIGARNIALRTLLIRQDWISTGALSTLPDVSDDEAKAAHRRRQAELRWSSDTSYWLSADSR